LSVLNGRTAAAALDYPGAKNEIDTAKRTLSSSLNRMAMEGEQIASEVKALQKSQNSDLVRLARAKEHAISIMEKENIEYRFRKEASDERVKDLYGKYEGNQHSMLFPYAPWEISQSSWYSWAAYNPYVNLNPMSRSGLLFLAFFLGFMAIIALGLKVYVTYSAYKPVERSIFDMIWNPYQSMMNYFRPPTFLSNPGRMIPDILKY
jgi:outer membrane murein-binding lipoprotein Lpp